MPRKIKIGISSCLPGNNIRYNGGNKLDLYLRDTLGEAIEWVSVCPEVEAGLGVPREPMELYGDPVGLRLLTVKTKKDRTDDLMDLIEKKLRLLERQGIKDFVFKARHRTAEFMMRRFFLRQGKSRGCARACLPKQSSVVFPPCLLRMKKGFEIPPCERTSLKGSWTAENHREGFGRR